MDKLYPDRRAAFERRVDAFRKLLEGPGPILYVHQGNAFPTEAETERLLAALRGRSLSHRFHVLLTAYPETAQDLSAFNGLVSTAPRSREQTKPPGREWEGDDGSWDAILGSFDLHPIGAAPIDAPYPMAAEPEPPGRGGWFKP